MFLDLESAVALAAESARDDAGGWWERKRLRQLFGPAAAETTALGHGFGPDTRSPQYAFLAADVASGDARSRRTLVFLRGTASQPAAIVGFDLSPKPDSGCWTLGGLHAAAELLEGSASAGGTPWKATGLAFLPRYGRVLPASPRNGAEGVQICSENAPEGPRLVAALQFRRPDGPPAAPVEPIAEIDLVGVRLANWAVLFHNGMNTNRSAVFFNTRGDAQIHCLVTGLAPGGWQIWRNGWLVDIQAGVHPAASSLYFEGPAGEYFLRMLG